MNNESCIYKELSNGVNNFSFSNKEFCNAFRRDHRYLQGEIFRLAIDIISTCASDDYEYDGRNDFAHNIAKDIKSKCPEYFN